MYSSETLEAQKQDLELAWRSKTYTPSLVGCEGTITNGSDERFERCESEVCKSENAMQRNAIN
eukprot:m.365772 g.365772  ORF g.365772 m.365772 type:complete len:63 (+) comp33097_c0_seq1:35-223(+)